MVKGKIEWEHNPEDGLVLCIKPGLDELFTGEAHEHMKAVRKEMLLGLKSLIDLAVTHIDEKEKNTKKTSTKIEVE